MEAKLAIAAYKTKPGQLLFAGLCFCTGVFEAKAIYT